MDAWEKRFIKKRSEVFRKLLNRYSKIKKPDYIRQEIFDEVVESTALKKASDHMTNSRKRGIERGYI